MTEPLHKPLMNPPTYSVVVPVFRSEATLPELLTQVASLRMDAPAEIVFVIDGSPDNSYALLKTRLPTMPFPSQLICLSRNFGRLPRSAAASKPPEGGTSPSWRPTFNSPCLRLRNSSAH